MWESRSDFQVLWEAWESLFLAFRAFLNTSFPRPFTPTAGCDASAARAGLGQTSASCRQTTRSAVGHSTLHRNPPRFPAVPPSAAPRLHSGMFARISISSCLVARCDGDALLADTATPTGAPDTPAPMARITLPAFSNPAPRADAARFTPSEKPRRLPVATGGWLSEDWRFPV